MNCTQIRLANTLLYITPDGPLYVNNTQLAYYKLRNVTHIDYADLQRVLSIPAPDGLWFALHRNGRLHVIHQDLAGNCIIVHDGYSSFSDSDLYAVYPSMQDVVNDFPEYFI